MNMTRITKGAKQLISHLAEEKKRIDNRGFDDMRKLEIEYDISDQAEGSARVKLGETEVYVGVKVGLGTPYPDTPNKGNLIVNAEVTPLADEEYEPGPPRDWEVAIARVIDRGIRESGSIDVKKLCIKEGERTWEVFVDVYVINDDGNLVGAGGIGALAALKHAKLPAYNKKEDKIDKEGKRTKAIPITAEPIPISFAKVGSHLFVDPKKEEVQNATAHLVVTVDEKDRIVSLQRQGSEGLTFEEIEKCLKTAIKQSKIIRKQLA
ncbi:RNA-binding protein [archaeon CG10_big_fil_rev_8_21_14_0_10_43_11]|nr:MAG: RNA-binding protein [archaeon CG10_big_fil_rev_8_21_14_0_10_43_11]